MLVDASMQEPREERAPWYAIAIALVLGALPIAAMVLGGWMWWQERQGARVSGDLRALGVEADAAAPRTHPLLMKRGMAAWQRVGDGEQLGRGGTNAFEDAESVLGERTGRRAVGVMRLGSGVLAWASPAQVRLVDPARRSVLATIDPRGGTIESVAAVGELLLVAEAGRVTAFASDGAVAWQRELDIADDARIELVPLADGALVAVHGGSSLSRLDAGTGGERWSVELPGELTHVRRIGGERAVAMSHDGGATHMRAFATGDGERAWARQWSGWRPSAIASDGRRVVASLVTGTVDERCGSSGLVELDAARGATRSTLRLDSRIAATDLRVDSATGRLGALMEPRRCSLALVEPRLDVYGARGLARIHQVALPARPCSGLAARGRLFVTATCDELVAVDALRGRQAWTHPLPEAAARRDVAVSATHGRVVATDDVGSLAVLERRAQPAAQQG